MARQREFTDAWVQGEFYRRFYRATRHEQSAIIRGLEAVRDCKASDAQPVEPSADAPPNVDADAERQDQPERGTD